jgi:hypothetical protein
MQLLPLKISGHTLYVIYRGMYLPTQLALPGKGWEGAGDREVGWGLMVSDKPSQAARLVVTLR